MKRARVKSNLGFFIFIFWVGVFFFVSFGSLAYAENNCEEILLTEQMRWLGADHLQAVKESIRQDMRAPSRAMNALAIDWKSLNFVRYLGHGAQGVVVLVEKDGQPMALKLFYSQFSDYFPSAFIVQKHLGFLEMAPNVTGYLDDKSSTLFVDSVVQQLPKRAVINRTFEYAILMEFVDQIFLKDVRKSIPVTPEEKKALTSRAHEILAVLPQIGIHAADIDAVVTSDKKLILVDFGFYEVEGFTRLSGLVIFSNFRYSKKSLLLDIKRKTSTLRVRWDRFIETLGFDKSEGVNGAAHPDLRPE